MNWTWFKQLVCRHVWESLEWPSLNVPEPEIWACVYRCAKCRKFWLPPV